MASLESGWGTVANKWESSCSNRSVLEPRTLSCLQNRQWGGTRTGTSSRQSVFCWGLRRGWHHGGEDHEIGPPSRAESPSRRKGTAPPRVSGPLRHEGSRKSDRTSRDRGRVQNNAKEPARCTGESAVQRGGGKGEPHE